MPNPIWYCTLLVEVLAPTIFLNILAKDYALTLLNCFGQISGQDKQSANSNNPVTPRLNPVPPLKPQLMRSSDTPPSQQTVVNGRIAGYGISPNHSYDAHSQGEYFLGYIWNLKYLNIEFCVKIL